MINEMMQSNENANVSFYIENIKKQSLLIFDFQSSNFDHFNDSALHYIFDKYDNPRKTENGLQSFRTYKELPRPVDDYSQILFKQIQEKLERLSREELVQNLKKTNEELQAKKKELDVINSNLKDIIQDQTKELQNLLNQKTNFIVQLGHDLGTPLNPILNLIPIIQNSIEDEKLKEMLDIVKNNSKKLLNIVKKTVKYSRITSNEFQPTLEKVHVIDAINHILSNINENSSNNFSIENQIDQDLIIYTDKQYFEEIFDELIGNAIKFSPNGGTVVINASIENQKVIFSIQDQGIGINSNHLDIIFDEFYKIDESRHDLNSNGLGLTIIRIIIEKLGDSIWAESTGEGKGSTFYFTMPLFKEDKIENNNG
jgi:signal transduction histidine kinase